MSNHNEKGDIVILRQTKPEMCGGTDATLDKSAPKTINSRDIVYFKAFSALGGVPEKGGLEYLSAFAAPAGENTFIFLEKSDCAFRRRDEKDTAWALIKENVLPALADLIKECGLAESNGFHSETHGLPENFGGRVSVKYASGEKISFSNNQSPILSYETGVKAAAFFDRALKCERAPLPDLSALTQIRFSEERKDGGYTKCSLTLNPDGTWTNRKSQCFDPPKVYEGEKQVNAETVAAIKKAVSDCGVLAWEKLPQSEYSYGGEKTLTFVFGGAEVSVKGGRVLPDEISRGFFDIELELVTKN
ncbi:MAG: hypothetical protein IJS65_08405 [Clostridia bacterium]|nr:hypothetical protein [Clostridia bacterium]